MKRRLRLARQRPCRDRSRQRRTGLTLLEVLLATSIFLGSITAILQVLRVGHESRLSARLDAEAALLCESLMGEYLSGMSPLAEDVETPFPSPHDQWVYTTTIEDGPGTSLLKLTVLVEHKPNGQDATTYFQLSRLMRDPQLFLDAAMDAAAAEDSE
ncbi:MAG: hypothetical protein R3C59_19740 [Planctomycetaceae bacterium]